MANQTLTNQTLNHDAAALSGLLDGETYTINNSTLIYNGDVRWGQNAAVPGAMTISATEGGSIQLDGTTVWELPFSASTGTAPAFAALGSNGVTGGTSGATGELFRVWATGSLTPVAAAASMPPTGWIKLRTKTGIFSSGEIVTLPGGATITISGEGKRSWIHIVSREVVAHTIPRLGSFIANGDWYELGTTNGADSQTFQFPVTDCCPAIQIETAAGSDIYEWWLNAGSRWATVTVYVATDARGKYFGMVNSTGVITIANRVANSCGFKPPTGCKVRIPNIILSSSVSPYTVNSVNATVGSRPSWTTTSSGDINLNNVTSNWNHTFTSPYNVIIQNSSILHYITISNTANNTTVTNTGIGMDLAIAATPFTASNLFTNLTMTDVRMTRYSISGAGQSVAVLTDIANLNITRVQAEGFGNTTTVARSASSNAFLMTRCFDGTMTNCVIMNGTVAFVTCSDITITGTQYCDILLGTTTTAAGNYAFTTSTGSKNITMNGFSFFSGFVNVHPYSGILTTGTGCNGINLINIGTAAAPLNAGGSNPMLLLLLASVTLNLLVRRVYIFNSNGAGSSLNIANTVQNIILENVWSDGNDLVSNAGLNVVSRGNRWYPSPTGQVASYSRHFEDFFETTTTGGIMIAANEALAETATQVSTTLAAGSGFTSTGNISMKSVNDVITWTMPHFALGHTKLAGRQKFFAVGTLLTNFDFDYQIDTGSGFSAWKFLMGSRVRSANGTAGTNTMTITTVGTTRGPAIGDYIGSQLGTHFATNTTITNVVGGVLTLSANILVSFTGNLFYWREIGDEPTFSAATGVKLKVRATAKIANNTNALTYLVIPTTTNSTDQQIQYPLPGIPISLTGLVTGSEVRVYVGVDPATAVEIAGIESSTASFDFTHSNTGSAGYIVIYALGYQPLTIQTTYSASSVEIPVQQVIDRVYANA